MIQSRKESLEISLKCRERSLEKIREELLMELQKEFLEKFSKNREDQRRNPETNLRRPINNLRKKHEVIPEGSFERILNGS